MCAGVADVSELRTQESRKSVGDFSPALFWMLGHQHHGLQSVQLVAEHLALLGKGNLLLHRRTDPKELALCWLVGTSVHKIHRFPRTDVPTSQHTPLKASYVVSCL